MANTKTKDENRGIHMTKIIESVPCRRHGADIGQACWNIGSIHGILKAICDRRARHAGANGNITKESKRGNASTKKEYRR